jgi:glucose/arabinose dehydrogenase
MKFLKSKNKSLLKGKYLFISLFFILVLQTRTYSQSFPANFAGVQLAKDLDPVGMDVAPDGRVFLAEKVGRIRVVKNGTMLPTPLITIPNVDNFSERGLLQVIVDPEFTTNKYIYTFYTRKFNGVINNRVSRFKVDGDISLPSSEEVLIDIDPVDGVQGYHNGGGLVIKNKQIYIATGESTVASNSQTLNNLKGKVLRINTDGTIPTDNPFYTQATGKNRAIWALGFRNPFRMSVQNGTGRIFANDVGAGAWEEINEIEAGKNYGWPGIEGVRTNQTAPANYKDPFYAYAHSNGACSITGGAFYNPETATFPTSYIGKYFYADYCAGWIKAIDLNTKAVENFGSGIDRPLEIAVSKDGILYFIARGGIPGGSDAANTSSSNGILWKVEYTGNGKPVIAVQPTDRTVSIDQSTTFRILASGNPSPTYQWQRNGVNIPGANLPSYTFENPKLTDNDAKFKVIVTNSAGTVTSNEAILKVINNQSPIPKFTSPVTGAKYSGGDVITYSATATDTEDGVLPDSAFTWKVELFHFDDPDHSHPALDPTTGSKSGTFTIPTEMETSPNVLFRFFLTVTDSKGATKTISTDVVPILNDIKLETNPPGLSLKIDGNEQVSPINFKGAKGILRQIEAVSPQTLNGKVYIFSSWSDNGLQSHSISTPGANTTYTANFVESTGAIVPGSIYELEPQHAIGQRLDVRGSSAQNSTSVDMAARNGNLNQRWKFISRGKDLYEIEPQNAIGKRLDVAGASTANNAEIHIFQGGTANNQLWKAYLVADGIYGFEPQNAIGNRLDIELIDGIQSARSRVLDNGNSQRWRLFPVVILGTEDNYFSIDRNQFYLYQDSYNNEITVKFPTLESKYKTAIQIHNLQGQLLMDIDVTGNTSGTKVMDQRSLPSGIYLYSLVVDKKIVVTKRLSTN